MSDDEKMRGEEPKKEEFKVFVGGLSWQMKEADLKDAFSKFDPISAEVMLDKHTGRPRGFGFVVFRDKLSLDDAIRDMHEKELEGRKISCVRAVPQDQTKPGTPAAALGGGTGARATYGGRDRGYGGDRRGYGDRGYDRGYGGGYGDRGYDRGYGGGYDPRYAPSGGYDRGYSDRGYGGYGGYDRGAPAYGRDPYGRDAYAGAGASGYGSYGSYDRGGYDAAGYDSRYAAGYEARGGYDDRGAGGPDRRGYSAPRGAAPYDRPADRRPADVRR